MLLLELTFLDKLLSVQTKFSASFQKEKAIVIILGFHGKRAVRSMHIGTEAQ